MNTVARGRGAEAIGAAFGSALRQRRPALITYLTLGYPTPAESLTLAPALQAGGADVIELGVPFSDPVADGPAIQRASHAALRAGVTPAACLEMAGRLRDDGIQVPLVLMGYYNPIHAWGLAAYVRACVGAGVDGLIVPDLPPEEAGPLMAACEAWGVALIFLAAPNTSESRLIRLAEATRGFLYLVSRLGTTGAAGRPSADLEARLALARRHARTPVAVGFGISRPEQMQALIGLADGVIVGSGVVERAAQGAPALRAYVASLRAALEPERVDQ